jgi:hypothetical protein
MRNNLFLTALTSNYTEQHEKGSTKSERSSRRMPSFKHLDLLPPHLIHPIGGSSLHARPARGVPASASCSSTGS